MQQVEAKAARPKAKIEVRMHQAKVPKSATFAKSQDISSFAFKAAESSRLCAAG